MNEELMNSIIFCENDFVMKNHKGDIRELVIEMKMTIDNQQAELDRLTAENAASKWVSVSERLPEENKPVLINVKCYVYPKIGWHCHNIHIPQWSTADDLYFHDVSYAEVTHWMPLPQPPEGGK